MRNNQELESIRKFTAVFSNSCNDVRTMRIGIYHSIGPFQQYGKGGHSAWLTVNLPTQVLSIREMGSNKLCT